MTIAKNRLERDLNQNKDSKDSKFILQLLFQIVKSKPKLKQTLTHLIIYQPHFLQYSAPIFAE